jgi:hypothetical protein
MPRNRSRKAKSLRAARGNARKQNITRTLPITLVKSSPRQTVWDAWLPALPTKVTTTVTTGVIAHFFVINISNIQAFATRFASTFDEYRIVQARFKISMFSSLNPGLLMVFMDENSFGAPTLAEARERAQKVISAANVEKPLTITWTAADPQDLLYTAIGSGFTPAAFKVYSDNANFGSSIVATDYFETTAEFRIQFRGLQGV